MKQFKMFWGLLFVLLLLTTTTVGADMILPDCNSNFYLDYGEGYTLCTDSSSAHSYFTVGWTYGTPKAYVAVYVLDNDGEIMAQDSSSGFYDEAIAWWTRSTTTRHKHEAGSGLIQ